MSVCGPPGSLDTTRSRSATSCRWIVSGTVQGVGFRPFVYRLAGEHGLRGWVVNRTGLVEVVAAGTPSALRAFEHDLLARAPRIARPRIARTESLDGIDVDDFCILDSDGAQECDIHLPPDYFVCDDCLRELNDPRDRRFRYPFINCTQCGPRYTLIESLPYDRANTSMAPFALCDDCLAEYRDPADRRFHAEPVACPVCGPQLEFRYAAVHTSDTAAALTACVQALQAGAVVAVKGVGGYHLMCDAASEPAIRQLRERKPRPHKPLAVMFPARDDLRLLRGTVLMDAVQEQLLCSPQRPVVLCRRRPDARGLDGIAPGLDEIGVMLPYSPLHHLLLNDCNTPLVATSANISGEPVLTDRQDVEQRLAGIADAFLHHDRRIVRPADDSVYRTINGAPRPLRLGRGSAPLELELPFRLERPLLAVGGHLKNTLALAWENRAVLSPHIGDMGSARSLAVFEQLAADLQSIHRVHAELLVADAHPAYVTSRWARQQPLPVFEVQHHRAHASALVGETGEVDSGPWLVFTWDGTGYGSDGTLWGGEAFLGRPGNWRRVASMRPFRLPGGEKAGREPWRSAVALAWECGETELADTVLQRSGLAPASADLLHQAWHKSINCPQTSAVGRLFDAAAALTGVCREASFEGQGPMWLEALADRDVEPLPLPLRMADDGVLRCDWQPLLQALADDRVPVARRASLFHATLAHALLQQALALRERYGECRVGLCGGVFQNRRLGERCTLDLRERGFAVTGAERVPVNDAGLSFGQLVEYACGGAARVG